MFFFFFNDTATTEIYTLSLHDALPISRAAVRSSPRDRDCECTTNASSSRAIAVTRSYCRSEEHTSELQSQSNLVCRLLLEKKNDPTRQLCRCVLTAALWLPGLAAYGAR